jgi:hypothetical protein
MYAIFVQIAIRRGAVVSQEVTQPREVSPPNGVQFEKLIHLALPVRLIHMHMENGERGGLELACTYDIHPRGARLLSARDVRVGDLLTVERGRLKSVCQVIWTADPNSALRGQFTVECVEGSRVPRGRRAAANGGTLSAGRPIWTQSNARDECLPQR